MDARIIHGESLAVLKTIESETINCCVTSPPYFGLRDYGVGGQIGLESSVDEYVQKLVEVFREVKRVLKDDGTLWLNLGDSYNSSTQMNGQKINSNRYDEGLREQSKWAGHRPKIKGLKPKDLIGIPWRVAFALQADGWYLRQDIIWHKPNPMPESVRDRCTKSHEYIFLLSKSEKYYFDIDAIKEQSVSAQEGRSRVRKKISGESWVEAKKISSDSCCGFSEKRNKRSVWTVTTKPFKGAHFATFPPDLIEPCILAGCPKDGIVLDPFFGAGTVGLVSSKHGRKYIGIELNPEYVEIAKKRVRLPI